MAEVFWYLETRAAPDSAQSSVREKVLPTGTVEFVFNLEGDRIVIHQRGSPPRPIVLSGAIACGVHSEYFELHGGGGGPILGVHFRPGGAYPLLGAMASGFANRHVNLQQIFGDTVSGLRDQLASMRCAQSSFEMLEAFLIRQIDPTRSLAPVVARVLSMLDEDPFRNPVEFLKGEFGITDKGLIDAFKRQVGLTPKRFARVLRFQRVLALLTHERSVNWADMAYRCGYYDQSHFARDFRDFSGFSPGEYRARAGANPNHVPAD